MLYFWTVRATCIFYPFQEAYKEQLHVGAESKTDDQEASH